MTYDAFPELLREFALDARERLDRLERVFVDTGARLVHETAALDALRAELHTLKGNAGMMGFTDLQSLAHRMEDTVAADRVAHLDVDAALGDVDAFRRMLNDRMTPTDAGSDHGTERPLTEGGIRVPFAAIDGLVDLVAELVILRNRLGTAVACGRRFDAETELDVTSRQEVWREVVDAEAALARMLDVIQDRVLALRLTPLSMVFGSVKRIVHDEMRRLNKQVAIHVVGGETPLDKALLELAAEALGHLVRNAVIHGIETPDDRRRVGKPAEGVVHVEASVKGDEVQIAVSDDGAGLDPERLIAVARTRGLSIPADVYSLLFAPGFSTQTTADIGAGRGVGLSAVRDAVERRGGEIEIRSAIGSGTTFLLRLPLSVSITRALLTQADGNVYAVPLTSVVTSLPLAGTRRHEVSRNGVLRWRDQLISLVDTGCLFGTRLAPRESGYVLIIEAAGRRRGLIVDDVHGIQDIVVKGLDPVVGNPSGVGGATVLGDGRAVLLLEPRGLVDVALGEHQRAS